MGRMNIRQAGLLATAAAAAVSNGWPSMTPATGKEFSRIGMGLPVSDPSVFAQIHQRFYHAVDYATGGTTQINFFANQGKVDHVCNINQGILPDERPVWITGVCVTPQDLTAQAGGVPSVARSGVAISANATTGFTRSEEWRTILQAGLLKLSISDRLILDAQDLTQFPQDGGFYANIGVSTSVAATTVGGVAYCNGQPLAGNRFMFGRPYAVLPGQQISASIFFQQALTITVAGRLKLTLVCESIAPRSL